MVNLFDYRRHLPEIEDEVLAAVKRVLHSNRLVLGPETEQFESEFAAFTGSKYAVGVGSGTSALQLALAALDIAQGDEVLTVSNTCCPTIAAIRLTGAVPVFVDVGESDLLINPDLLADAVTTRTRCILPVHLWGHSADMHAIGKIAQEYDLVVVEDCAQAHGTRCNEDHAGTFGEAGCFSFYPTKNIGAFGDAGAVITDDEALYDRLKRTRVYGYDDRGISMEEGNNARINEIQAAILRIKLSRYSEWLARRIETASHYNERIVNPAVTKPICAETCTPSYHQYVVRSDHRDQLATWLRQHDILTGIHYPVPVHLMPAYRFLDDGSLDLPVTTREARRILSLPIHDALTHEEVDHVISTINAFTPPTGT